MIFLSLKGLGQLLRCLKQLEESIDLLNAEYEAVETTKADCKGLLDKSIPELDAKSPATQSFRCFQSQCFLLAVGNNSRCS